MHEYQVQGFTFQVFVSDIADVSADAIVCAANSYGIMRGGVAQALRVRGGDVIEDEARQLAPIPLGNAVYTTAGSLKAKWVVHAPAMRDPVEIASPDRIRRAAFAATSLAATLGAESIAFPAIGTGVGEVSLSRGAKSLLEGILECEGRQGKLRLVKLVARVAAMEAAFVSAIELAG